MTDRPAIDPRAAARWDPVYMQHGDTIVAMRRAGHSRTQIAEALGVNAHQLDSAISLLLDLGRIERVSPTWHHEQAPAPRYTATGTLRGCQISVTADSAEAARRLLAAMTATPPSRLPPAWRARLPLIPNIDRTAAVRATDHRRTA